MKNKRIATEDLPSFVPSKKHAVRGYRCCDSRSCFGHRAGMNAKARKPRDKK